MHSGLNAFIAMFHIYKMSRGLGIWFIEQSVERRLSLLLV